MTSLMEPLATPSSNEKSPSAKRLDIQGMRALAVTLVILAHAGVPGFEGGYVGVDVFFVISGFVITGVLLRRPAKGVGANLKAFYSRRIRRIVPAATLVLVATIIAAYIVLGQNIDPALPGDVRWSALFAANFRFILTSTPYFVPGLPPSLVNQYWSLAVEEQFYLVYPLLVFGIVAATPSQWRRSVLAGVVASGVVVSAWWSLVQTASHPVAAYYSPFTRFWELALGGLIALVPVARLKLAPMMSAVLSAVALAVVIVCALTFNQSTPYPGTLAWWPCAAAAVLIVAGSTPNRGPVAMALTRREVVFVGDISYSLYLFHFVWLALPAETAHPPTAWWATWLEIAAAVLCAVGSYYLIENPIRHSRRLERDFVSVLLMLATLVAASVAASYVVANLAGL